MRLSWPASSSRRDGGPSAASHFSTRSKKCSFVPRYVHSLPWMTRGEAEESVHAGWRVQLSATQAKRHASLPKDANLAGHGEGFVPREFVPREFVPREEKAASLVRFVRDDQERQPVLLVQAIRGERAHPDGATPRLGMGNLGRLHAAVEVDTARIRRCPGTPSRRRPLPP